MLLEHATYFFCPDETLEAAMAALSPEFRRFRLMFISARAEYFFTLGGLMTCTLPTIDVRQEVPLAPQIHDHCKEKWFVHCEIVDILVCGSHIGLIILRLPHLTANGSLFPFRSRTFEELLPSHFSPAELQALWNLRVSGTTGRSSFTRLGWLDDARVWLSNVLLAPPNSFELIQHHVSASKVVVAVRTQSGERYWLKGATTGEATLTRFLATEAHQFVPELVAHNESLGVWLTRHMGASFSTKDVITEEEVWSVAVRLAQLQKRTADMMPRLREAIPNIGSTDHLLNTFDKALRTKYPLISSSVSDKQLETLSHSLDGVLSCIADLRLPQVLVHDDLHQWNILFDRSHVFFGDWEEAHIGNPFENAEHLSLLSPSGRCVQLVELAYLSVWQEQLGYEEVLRAIELSRPVAIAVRIARLVQRHSQDPCLAMSLPTHSLRILLRQLESSLRLVAE